MMRTENPQDHHGAPMKILAAILALSLPTAPAAPAASAPATDIGVCSTVKSFLTSEENQRRAESIRAAGIDLVRTDFTWREIEKRKGAYDFKAHDAMMAVAANNGIAILGLISHTPPWAAPITDHLDEWLAFVDATVRRYPQVRHWEVFNEPDLKSFWGSAADPAGYAKLLRLTHAKIKTIDPALFVVSGGISGAGNNVDGGYARRFAEPMVAAGIAGSFDAFGIHPYRWPHAPEETIYEPNTYAPKKATLEETLGRYRALLDQHGCAGKPIWVTECGYTAMPGTMRVAQGKDLKGVTDEEQAQFLPRSILLALQYGASAWMWFTTSGIEKKPDEREHWFGLLHPNGTPRPAYDALKALRHAYPPGSTLIKEHHLKEPTYRLAWKRPDGKTTWGLWIIERGATRKVPVIINGPIVECFDALGNVVTLQVTDRRAQASLSGRMLYIVGPDAVDVRQ